MAIAAQISPFWRNILDDPDAGALALPAEDIQPYIHEQTSPSTEWIVNHNLDRHPGVQVRNLGGAVVTAKPVNQSANQLRVHFSVPTAGSAYCL
jgi:hypothetical protein